MANLVLAVIWNVLFCLVFSDIPFILYPSNHNNLSAAILKTYIYQITHQYSQLICSSSSSDFISKYQSLHVNNRYGFVLLSNTNENENILSTLFENAMMTTSKYMDKHVDAHSIHLVNDRNILCLGHSLGSSHYCIFSLLQLFGVRFRIHNDIIPRHFYKNIKQLFFTSDTFLNNYHWFFEPTFSLRGINPFHAYSEGPDWWNHNDYKFISEQIYKMRMNFQGYHTYPHREPLVWAGLNDEFDSKTGDVTDSYPTSWMTTKGWVGGPDNGGGDWGGIALNTSDYVLGSRLLYHHECYSNDIQQTSIYPKLCPFGTEMSTFDDVINNAGNLLHDVFNYAKILGIKNCVGTETPLGLPPSEPCYGPICPLRTYYSSLREDHFVTTTNCLECQNLYKYIRTEGWLYLTQTNVFDIPLSSCFDGRKGMEDTILVIGTNESACPQEYQFVRVTGYASKINKTVNGTRMIPLIAYWNKNIKDHWSVANISSIKEAVKKGYTIDTSSAIVYVLSDGEPPEVPEMNATKQYYTGMFNRITAKYPIDYYWIWTPEQWEWSHVAVNNSIVEETIIDINDAYQAMKNSNANFSLATCGWVIGPEGNRSYFNAYLPKDIIMSSIEGYLGKSVPDPAYKIISNDRETWDIPWMEDDTDLTALQIWVNRTMNHIHIAHEYGVDGIMGLLWRTQEVSPQLSALSLMGWNTTNEYGQRHQSVSSETSLEFWMDWVQTEFNLTDSSIIHSMSTLFNDEIDSNLPNTWNDKLPMHGCPGNLYKNTNSWSVVSEYYGFVDKFNAYRTDIVGTENVERFMYWRNMFEYIRMMGKVGVDWGHLNESNYDVLLNDTTVMLNYLMASVNTKGTMGTLTDIQQQLIPTMILGNKLSLSKEYSGSTRMWVMTPRSIVILTQDGDQYSIDVMILSRTAPNISDIIVYYRELSNNANWHIMNNFKPKGDANRQVYIGEIAINSKMLNSNGFEFYIQSKADGRSLRWPVVNSYAVTVV